MNQTAENKSRVTRCEDGVYRWTHRISLFKNPTFFFLVWRIFFFIFIGIFTVVCLSDLKWGMDRVLDDLKFLGFFLIGMTAVTGLGYLIYAAVMGGEYIVEFEMNEKGILHRQIAAQAEKAKKAGQAAMAAGLAAGRWGAVSAGGAAQRTEMFSDFAKTRKVIACPRQGLIKVNGVLEHNRVYVSREDFDFVRDYIVSHCPSAKS